MSLPKTPFDGEGLDGEGAKALNAYARYASLGFQFVAAMGVFGWLGWWLDGRLGTYPLMMIVGLFLGATGGFVSLIKAIPPSSSRRAPQRDDDTPPSP